MILGLAMVVVGNILVWQSEEQTTQFFTGWILGAVVLAVAGGLPRVPKTIFLCVATYFIVMNNQKTTLPKIKLNCVNGVQKIIDGVDQCVCRTPYVGRLCDECAVGAIIENRQRRPTRLQHASTSTFSHIANICSSAIKPKRNVTQIGSRVAGTIF